MKGVDTMARIRREFFVRGKTIKEIVRELHVSRNTVRKVLRSGATEFTYAREVSRCRSWGAGRRSWIGGWRPTRRSRRVSG
jgi:orotate phosphoribosyltransferase-like protein